MILNPIKLAIKINHHTGLLSQLYHCLCCGLEMSLATLRFNGLISKLMLKGLSENDIKKKNRSNAVIDINLVTVFLCSLIVLRHMSVESSSWMLGGKSLGRQQFILKASAAPDTQAAVGYARLQRSTLDCD